MHITHLMRSAGIAVTVERTSRSKQSKHAPLVHRARALTSTVRSYRGRGACAWTRACARCGVRAGSRSPCSGLPGSCAQLHIAVAVKLPVTVSVGYRRLTHVHRQYCGSAESYGIGVCSRSQMRVVPKQPQLTIFFPWQPTTALTFWLVGTTALLVVLDTCAKCCVCHAV